MRIAAIVIIVATSLIAVGCGGGDDAGGSGGDRTLKPSFINCIYSAGTMEVDASLALRSASFYKVQQNEVKEGSFIRESLDRRFAINDDALGNIVEADPEAADELEKLVWEKGEGGAALWMGETDQSALVLVAKPKTQERVAQLVAAYFEPIFDTEPEDDEVGFDEFTSSRIKKVGTNAVVIDTNPDGFTERTERHIKGCEEGK